MGVTKAFRKMGSALKNIVQFERKKGAKVGVQAQEAVVRQTGQAAVKPVRTRFACSVSQGGVATGEVKTESGKRSFSLAASKQTRRRIAHAKSSAVSRRASRPVSQVTSHVVNIGQLWGSNSPALDDLLKFAAEPEQALDRKAEALVVASSDPQKLALQIACAEYVDQVVPPLDPQYQYLLDDALESATQSKANSESELDQTPDTQAPIYAGPSRRVKARVLATNAAFDKLVEELADRVPEPAPATLPAWDEVKPEHQENPQGAIDDATAENRRVSDEEFADVIASIMGSSDMNANSGKQGSPDVDAELDALIHEFENAGAWMQAQVRS
jgi:hypothetical protein